MYYNTVKTNRVCFGNFQHDYPCPVGNISTRLAVSIPLFVLILFSLYPNNLGLLYIFPQKYIYVNIFHNDGTAMVSSQLFLTHVLTAILRLNLCLKGIIIFRKSKYIGKYSVWRVKGLPTSPLICQLSAGQRSVWVCDAVSAVSYVCFL